MECFNFLARVALGLGRYSHALHLVRTGLKSTSWDEPAERAPRIYGLMLVALAKAELEDVEHAVADIDQAYSDWTLREEQIIAGGVTPDAWKYAKAAMSLVRAWT